MVVSVLSGTLLILPPEGFYDTALNEASDV
jgi:hypothetical protein